MTDLPLDAEVHLDQKALGRLLDRDELQNRKGKVKVCDSVLSN